jgi:hypothetical protein
MKRLSLSIACLLYGLVSLAQSPVPVNLPGTAHNLLLVAKSETMVLSPGFNECHHNWVVKKKSLPRCEELHGIEGCENYWPNETKICTACSRKENFKISYKWLNASEVYIDHPKKSNRKSNFPLRSYSPKK